MKRLAAVLICVSLLLFCSMTAFAEEPAAKTDNAVITATVPQYHTITVTVDSNVEVRVNDEKGSTFNVERLSEPTIEIKIPDGEELAKAVLNGEDITDKISNGTYTLPPVYEDLHLVVDTKTKETTTDSKPTSSERTNTGTTSSKNENGNSSVTSSNVTSPKTGNGATVIPLISMMFIEMFFIALTLRKKEKDN